MNIKELLNNANNQMNNNFQAALKNENYVIGSIVELIACYKEHSSKLEKDDLVDEIVYDCYTAIHLALSGLYRHSYISLRCALELGISLMRFKDNHYDYLLWKNNQEDIIWSRLIDYETGVLSKKYLNLFRTGSFDVLIERTKSYYRECSEYVHGKYEYIDPLREYNIQYNDKICHEILIMCKNIVSVLNLLLNIRFNDINEHYYDICEELRKIYEV